MIKKYYRYRDNKICHYCNRVEISDLLSRYCFGEQYILPNY